VTRAARRGLRATPGSDFFQTGSLRRSRISFPLEAPTSGKTYSSNRFDVPFHQAEDFEILRPAKSLPAGIGFGGDVRVRNGPASSWRVAWRESDSVLALGYVAEWWGDRGRKNCGITLGLCFPRGITVVELLKQIRRHAFCSVTLHLVFSHTWRRTA